jgi:hypothetical protein
MVRVMNDVLKIVRVGEKVFRAKLGALLLLCIFLVTTVEAASVEKCDKPSKAGIKRCEQIYRQKDSPNTTWKTITYVNRARDMVEWEINFPRQGGDATYTFLLIGAGIMILSPELPRDNRLDFIKLLLVNAAKANPEFIPLGRYDWTSSRTDTDFMIRATRKK